MLGVTAILLPGAGGVSAHEHKEIGALRLTIGWGDEPSYSGFKNAVEVDIADAAGAPVIDPADRVLAQRALDDAVESRGDPRDIAEGGRAMLRASAAVAAGRFEAAIEHYEDAWLEAQEAMRRHREGHRRHD